MRDVNGVEQTEQVVMISLKALATMLAVSERTVKRLLDAGKMVRPVWIGRRMLWRREEVLRWIDAGCPPVHEWEGGAA